MSEAKLPVNNNLNNRKDSNFSASKLIKENGMLIALVAVVVIFQILTKGIMLKPLNITNLISTKWIYINSSSWYVISCYYWDC